MIQLLRRLLKSLTQRKETERLWKALLKGGSLITLIWVFLVRLISF